MSASMPLTGLSFRWFSTLLVALVAVAGLVFAGAPSAVVSGAQPSVAAVMSDAVMSAEVMSAEVMSDAATSDAGTSAAGTSATSATVASAGDTATPHPLAGTDARHRSVSGTLGVFSAPAVSAAAPTPHTATGAPRSSAAPLISRVLHLLLSINRT